MRVGLLRAAALAAFANVAACNSILGNSNHPWDAGVTAAGQGGFVGAGGRDNSSGAGGHGGGATGGSGATGGGGAKGGNGGTGGTAGTGGTPGTGGITGTGGAFGGSGGHGGAAGPGAGGAPGAGGSMGSGGTPVTTGAGGTAGAGATAGSGGGGATGGSGGTRPTGPCDIYSAASVPCGAAHSTVRALYASYAGPLYQVRRASDNMTLDVPVGTSGFADTSVQDSFCAGTSCTIPVIYDQSPNGNHLRVTWFAYWLQSGGNPAAIAPAARITAGGHTVYGIRSGPNVGYRTGTPLSGTAAVTGGSTTVTFSTAQTLPANTALLFASNAKDCPANSFPGSCSFRAYFTASAITASTTVALTAAFSGTSAAATAVWNATTRGIATGDQAESEYAVFDARTYAQSCCFDYGNAELAGISGGNASAEAISWGAVTQFGQSGGGTGPWVAADLENGVFEGYANGSAKVPSNTSVLGLSYVTAMLKGLAAVDCPSNLTSGGCFALKAGDATAGKLAYKWNADASSYGSRPPGYSPQKKQGAIVLGTGGDGSSPGAGMWFEGAITTGASVEATDDLIQANIVAAGYGQ